MTSKPTNEAGIGARIGLSFALEFKDDAGNVLKTIQCTSSLPLDQVGLTLDQAQDLINQQGQHDHDRQ